MAARWPSRKLESHDRGAEITEVFVERRQRGRGLGAVLMRSAIEAAGDVEDLWLCADDEDWPKRFYGRIGFRPVCTTVQFLRSCDPDRPEPGPAGT
jgi:GNAT superfamily N-acetyltransferase